MFYMINFPPEIVSFNLRNKRMYMKKLILILLLGFSFQKIEAMNWGEIRTEIRVRIKDTHTTRQRYTDTQLNNMMQAAARDISTVARPIVNTRTINLISGTTCYDLGYDNGVLSGSSLIDIRFVRFRNKDLPQTSWQQLDSEVGGAWQLNGGLPIKWYLNDLRVPSICMYPFPNSSASTGPVTVYHYQGWIGNTPSLSDSQDPFGNYNYKFQSFYDLFVWRVCADVYLLEGETDKANWYQTLYENRLSLLKDSIWVKESYSPGFSAGEKR